MEDTPAPDELPAVQEVATVRPGAPGMPPVSHDTLWRSSPHLIPASGQRHGIGWQDTKDGPCFVVARIRTVGAKVLDWFPLTEDGWVQAWAALAELDTVAAQATAKVVQEMLAAEARRRAGIDLQAQAYQAFASSVGATVFRAFGVQVLEGEGNVYTIGYHSEATKTNTSRLLGPLAGAQAIVTDGSQAWSPGRAMFLPISLAGLATKTKADAAVVFPDGTVHTAPLDGNAAVREAQKQAVQFNALAGASDLPAPETGNDPAVRLRKLQELRDAGLLTQEEYESKRAKVIDSI